MSPAQKKVGRKRGTLKTGGRQKGQPNKITADVRAAIALIIQGNVEEFQKRLKKIRDPKQYCDVYLKLAEFNIPKLAKVEQTVRHAITAEDMTDAELAAVAGAGAKPTGTDTPGPTSRPH